MNCKLVQPVCTDITRLLECMHRFRVGRPNLILRATNTHISDQMRSPQMIFGRIWRPGDRPFPALLKSEIFFSLFKQISNTNTERNKQYCFALPISFTINNPESIISVNLQCSIRIQFLSFATYNAFLPMTVTQIKIQKG